MHADNRAAAFEAIAHYFLTGAVFLVIGSSTAVLTEHFSISLGAVARFTAAMGLGRLITVVPVGWLTEKYGVQKTLGLGALLLLAFLVLFPLTQSVSFALGLCFLAGIGSGTQDTVCPRLLEKAYPNAFPGAISMGQVFYGSGLVHVPLLLGACMRRNIFFGAAFFLLAIPATAILLGLPRLKDFDMSSASAKAETKDAAAPRAFRPRLICLVAACFFYSGGVCLCSLYTAAAAQAAGVPTGLSVLLLTAYSAGSVLGSLLMVAVLRVLSPEAALALALGAAAFFSAGVLVASGVPAYFLLFFLMGFSLGAMFALFVPLASRLFPSHVSLVGAGVAVLVGLSDTLFPLLTAPVIDRFGAFGAFWVITAVLTASFLFALPHWILSRRKKEGQTV